VTLEAVPVPTAERALPRPLPLLVAMADQLLARTS
jgi:hypothetical protein